MSLRIGPPLSSDWRGVGVVNAIVILPPGIEKTSMRPRLNPSSDDSDVMLLDRLAEWASSTQPTLPARFYLTLMN
jgi:hypothetical protein